MGRTSSKAGGGGGGGSNANNNPLVNGIVDNLNNASGFVRLTQADRKQAVASIAGATDVGDSFVLGNGSPIIKTGDNAWRNGNIDLTTSEVLGMMVDAKNIGWSIKFNSATPSASQSKSRAGATKSNAVTGQSVKQAQKQLTQARGQATRAQQAYQKALDAISNFDWNQKNALSKMDKLIKKRDTASKNKDAAVLKRNKLQKQYTKVSQSFAKKQAKAKAKAIKNGAPLF